MSIAETMLAEFETQAALTRKFIERLPEDKLGWGGEILKKLDESVAAVRNVLPKFDDAAMNERWRFAAGEREFTRVQCCVT